MTPLTRQQMSDRLTSGHVLRVHDDGEVIIEQTGEPVPRAAFEAARDAGTIEQTRPGEWAISDKGRRHWPGGWAVRDPSGPPPA